MAIQLASGSYDGLQAAYLRVDQIQVFDKPGTLPLGGGPPRPFSRAALLTANVYASKQSSDAQHNPLNRQPIRLLIADFPVSGSLAATTDYTTYFGTEPSAADNLSPRERLKAQAYTALLAQTQPQLVTLLAGATTV